MSLIPNFLIIGAQKAGTTALINYLGNHPDIFVPDHKEISNFFDDDAYNRTFTGYPYSRYYEKWNGEKFAGNAPVNLLYFAERTSKRIHDFNPLMKLIVILRNPVKRAYSAYWYFVRCGLETESFESALKREKDILRNGAFKELSNFTYISHGLYFDQLTHFLKLFDKDQLLILLHDEFNRDPAKTVKECQKFLGVEECMPSGMLDKKFNVSSRAKIQGLHRFVYGENPVKQVYKRMIPEGFRQKIRNNLIRNIMKKNLEPFQYPSMDTSTMQNLMEIFEEPNARLQRMLGRDLSHWRNMG